MTSGKENDSGLWEHVIVNLIYFGVIGMAFLRKWQTGSGAKYKNMSWTLKKRDPLRSALTLPQTMTTVTASGLQNGLWDGVGVFIGNLHVQEERAAEEKHIKRLLHGTRWRILQLGGGWWWQSTGLYQEVLRKKNEQDLVKDWKRRASRQRMTTGFPVCATRW